VNINEELLASGLGSGDDEVVVEAIVVSVVRLDDFSPKLPGDGEGVEVVVEDLS
jgi:hypothetical protein